MGIIGAKFPTGVGMNRALPPTARNIIKVPHRRGDEPTLM